MIPKVSATIEKQIHDYLKSNCIGKVKAKSKTRIMNALELKDERMFRAAVHNLRMKEIPILSSSSFPVGYYFAANQEETEQALKELNNRTMNLHLLAKSIKNGLKRQFPGAQEKLFNGDLTA